MARPRNKFTLLDEETEKQFIQLCELQCTREEVCSWFKIGKTTLLDRIKEAYGKDATWSSAFDQFRGSGLISLRRKQFRLADKSAAMAIFLGKNYLNQVDVKTLDDVNKPITLNYIDAKKPGKKETVKVNVNDTKGAEQ